eukprot:GHVS01108908.1.p1 GENE.GHVS01108908.1~~GHVS01108908.1.p1  ORF type:complete len:322 (-),score=50.62 GHVS01108908.1:896-1861(-)
MFSFPTAPHKLVVGTRGSPLAVAQAESVRKELARRFPQLAVELQTFTTEGDRLLSVPLAEVGGKGLFTKELDEALLDGRVDVCVHSMKDVPTVLPSGTIISCVLPREDPRDVFLCAHTKHPRDLKAHSVVGSSSLRRQCQLLEMNRNIKVINFRGNVQTRLQKLKAGEVDATMLARAGLNRLGLAELPDSYIVDEILPAVGQGIIGLQCRTGDVHLLQWLKQLNCAATKVAALCERSFLRALDGNCRTPIAGHAQVDSVGRISFKGLIGLPNGQEVHRIESEGFGEQQAESVGDQAAAAIRRKAGPAFMEAIDKWKAENNM